MARLRTYPGREIPNPLLIDVCKGNVPIDVVLRDVVALTKVNYNSCILADGVPVTLRFANAVGEILTAGPPGPIPPLPFTIRNAGKAWTGPEIDGLRQLAGENTPTRVIGLKLGRPEAGVRAKASEERISRRPNNQAPYNRRGR